MEWMFPKIVFNSDGSPISTLLREDKKQKVEEEYREWMHEYIEGVSKNKEIEEAFDLIHSVETYLRNTFSEAELNRAFAAVVMKNVVRGYYGEEYSLPIKTAIMDRRNPLWKGRRTTKEKTGSHQPEKSKK